MIGAETCCAPEPYAACVPAADTELSGRANVGSWRYFVLALAIAAVLVPAPATTAPGVDESPAPILQWFESSYQTIESRIADVFLAGYGFVWLPPPYRADQGGLSVGYDVYDRFDLGPLRCRTAWGTGNVQCTTVIVP
ncbi:MAG: hypothetical protein M3461_20045 [Pseudomonadota bacterium]|nr:hypothetical protein [Pseudomonadota bacterium]